MKSRKHIWIVLTLLFVLPLIAYTKIQNRYSKEVNNVSRPYKADWLVSPEEEPAGDHKVSNAPECDIKGVLSCYDKDKLRVDILLNKPISYDFKIWYAIKFEYSDMIEYYTYYPVSGDLVYEKEVEGEIVDTQSLKEDEVDYAGVTDSGGEKNIDVYIIIDKDKHIAGDKGKKYFLTTTFYSGFLDEKDKMHIADETPPVNLYFKR